jgi:coenzyme F420-reducing hydrogenase delta subunit/ferredoxin
MTHVGEAPVEAQDGTWQPRLVALVCNWCTYTGADMAGTSRRTYSPSARIVRFLCTGRLDPLFIIKAFEGGADGVIASGCHPGDCHYVQGNYLARRRFTVFQSLMDLLGLDRRRLHFAWVSASEGAKWAKVVDEATAAVREAGPLGSWAAPVARGGVPIVLPEPETEPRAPSYGPELTAQLRESVASLLAEGRVSVVVGYAEGPLPDQTVPAFVTAPEDAAQLVWDERCVANLSAHLPEALRRRKGQGRIGLVVKSCDEKAFAGLLRENQLTRDDVLLIGVPCDGVWPGGKLAYKCYACDEAFAATADVTIGEATAGRAVAPDPRDAQLDALEQLSAEERRAFWQPQLDSCIRCYACRAVCPLCYCETCVAEKNRPQWIQQGIAGPGNTAWNVVRAMHLAGRCVGCDECARVCPADIRLDLLNRCIAREVDESFGYRAQADPAVAAPLTTFRPDDPGEAFL